MQSPNVAPQGFEEYHVTTGKQLVAAPPRMFAVVATEDGRVYALTVAYFREREMERKLFRRGRPPETKSAGTYRLHDIMVIANSEPGKSAVRELGEVVDGLDHLYGYRVVAADWSPSEDRERFMVVAADIIADRQGDYVGDVPAPTDAQS